MTSRSVKAIFLKATTAAVLAGTVLLAAPTQADAQQFAVGVQFGAPAYGPAYEPGPGYYDHLRWEREQAEIARRQAWERHEAWEQHERWEHREGWRDGRDWDRHDGGDRRRDDRYDGYNGWR